VTLASEAMTLTSTETKTKALTMTPAVFDFN
jgi:hypothetical protein